MTLDPNNANHTFYNCYVAYYWDYGILGVPVGGPAGTPMEAISVHSPTCIKVVSFVCQSYDANPMPPDPDPGPNEVLVQKALSKPFLIEMSDGSQAYTVAGLYAYLLLVPPSDTDTLNFPLAPYDLGVQNILYPSDFIKGLLGGNLIPSGQGPFGGVQAPA